MLFGLEDGGYGEVLQERPLRHEIRRYCSKLLSVFSDLYDIYHGKFQENEATLDWERMVQGETRKRIVASWRPEGGPRGHLTR